jgi:hypothetical protein
VQAWVHVLSFVDAETVVASVGLVSRAFHALSTEPQLWRRLLLRQFSQPPAEAIGSGSAAAGAAGASSSGGGDEAANMYAGDPDGWRKSFFAHRWLARSVPHHHHHHNTRTPFHLTA